MSRRPSIRVLRIDSGAAGSAGDGSGRPCLRSASVGVVACVAGASLAVPTQAYWLLPIMVAGGAGAATAGWRELRGRL